MRSVVRRGLGRADPDLAHSVHVEVHGLRPGRDHWFQFDAAGEESPVGHFRTAPGAFDEPRELRFAFVTCQDWPSGHYTAYRDMYQRDLDLDLVLHLGDYTYEYAIGGNNRGIPTPAGFEAETVDLRTYRLRHTLHKLDPDLQAMHAAVPFVVVWDDHEVQNDYSGIYPEYSDTSPAFLARRAAAYQAWYEHMPVRRSALGRPGDELRIYRRLRYGRLAEFTMLDDRQYRDDNPCGDGESLRCEAALAEDYSMLGPTQERWVAQGLRGSRARWNIIGQQLLLAELEHLPYQDERYWNDAWDGYPTARQRLLEQVVANDVPNPVFLTGDWHSTFVNDLKLDFKDPSAPTIATELVTPAITTGGDGTPYGPYYGADDPVQPAHPLLRGRPPGLLHGSRHARHAGGRAPFRDERRGPRRHRLHRADLHRRGRQPRRRRVNMACVEAVGRR